MSMLKAFADAEHSAVPDVRKRSVRVEREGVAVAAGASSCGTGYNEYAAVAVRTTRKESRGFDSERYVVKMRFIDRWGRLEDMVASVDDASGAIGYAASESSTACSFAFFRRRCGSTSAALVAASSLAACCPGPDRIAAIELCNSRPELPNLSLSVGFAQK
jgi:hypothetical protein